MKMSDLQYPMTIRPLTKEEGGGYLIEFQTCLAAMADGETMEEALHEAEDALKAWLAQHKNLAMIT